MALSKHVKSYGLMRSRIMTWTTLLIKKGILSDDVPGDYCGGWKKTEKGMNGQSRDTTLEDCKLSQDKQNKEHNTENYNNEQRYFLSTGHELIYS